MLEIFEAVTRAVADATRIRILKLLEHGEICVCQITTVLDLAPATVSKHLATLKAAGLVQQRRDGKWIYYRLAEREFNVHSRAVLDLVAGTLGNDPTISADRQLLARVLAAPVQEVCANGRAALDPESASPCCEKRMS